ncbi:hypothetical protein QBC32DRAFT_348279 [Pseudoneurospora amorphoporcata]|uniref:DUF7025 domain-containing protein n=1 Tax=Pseudoneurospora amorphoporcata TaxID=241081 RepID=A0AAN6NRL1_9PEZI|nr:hypothetical protein QBC32DRAFT_348279 [Pseudoneurospora amorphoporcata]
MALSEYRAKLPQLYPQPSPQPQPPPTTSMGTSQGQLSDGQGNGAGTRAGNANNTVQGTTQQQATKQSPSKGFLDIVEYHKPELAGEEVTIHPTSTFKPRRNLAKKKKAEYKYEDPAVILRRTWVEKNGVSHLSSVELEIHSKPLCAALRRIAAKCYESTDLTAFPIKLRSPFMELFFYRSEIRELADTATDPDLRRDAEALDQFIHRPDGVMASIIQDHERYSKDGQVVNDILWTIFPPNSLAVFDNGVVKECWIVRDVKPADAAVTDGELPSWKVTGLRLDYDGSSPGLVYQSFSTALIGARPQKISSLSLTPTQNYLDWKRLQRTLLARSKKLTEALSVDFSSFKCQSYSGPSWDSDSKVEHHHDQEDPLLSARQVDERFIMDFKAFSPHRRLTLVDLKTIESSSAGKKTSKPIPRGVVPDIGLHPADIQPRRRDDDSSSDSDSEQSKSRKPDLKTFKGVAEAASKKFYIDKFVIGLLFPALVPVFGLKSKVWCWALADQLQDVKWNMAAFRSLQLDQVTKNLVEALVKGHKHKKVVFDDVIACDKGRFLGLEQ